MITNNAMQLKAIVKNKAAEKKISAQLVMQNYLMERLLERILLSRFQPNFILKGGFLISAIVGLDTRTTMDLDTTIKGLTVTHESIQTIFSEILKVDINDNINFELVNITDIRETDDYPGIRVGLKANYPPMSVPLFVDVTTGDKITPREIEYQLPLLFDDRSIQIMGYNLETILAEKLETVLSRGIANTRPRDFYDIYILYTMPRTEINLNLLKQALEKTATKRGSVELLPHYQSIIVNVLASPQMQNFWKKYQKDFDYAKEISFEAACSTVTSIMGKLG